MTNTMRTFNIKLLRPKILFSKNQSMYHFTFMSYVFSWCVSLIRILERRRESSRAKNANSK